MPSARAVSRTLYASGAIGGVAILIDSGFGLLDLICVVMHPQIVA
jgi:hypothetical protein